MSTNSSSKGTSFIQFKYCDICRLNHKRGWKHVYSKRHQEIINNILKKFKKKISEAAAIRKSPVIHGSAWEFGAKFWCYFCKAEVDKHLVEGNETISHGGLLKHICLKEHSEMAGKFFFEHHIDHKKKAQYRLDEAKFAEFMLSAQAKITEYQETQLYELLKGSQHIRNQEMSRKWTVRRYNQMHPDKSERREESRRPVPPRQQGDTTPGFYTVQAHGTGLTCVSRTVSKTELSRHGNVHTGGKPPWLQPGSEEARAGRGIGPTMDDLQQEIEAGKKRKLPATRVGADFDAAAETGDNWLPSFGRVWSKNRREHDRKAIMKSAGGRRPAHTVVTPYVSAASGRPDTGPTTVTPSGTATASTPASSHNGHHPVTVQDSTGYRHPSPAYTHTARGGGPSYTHTARGGPAYTHTAQGGGPCYTHTAQEGGPSYTHTARGGGPSYTQSARGGGPSYTQSARGGGPSYTQSARGGPAYTHTAQEGGPSYTHTARGGGPSYTQSARGGGPSYAQSARGGGGSHPYRPQHTRPSPYRPQHLPQSGGYTPNVESRTVQPPHRIKIAKNLL